MSTENSQSIDIGIVQFYISHTCNLACPGCLSFNNFNISGHELWEDNKETARDWANVIRPEDFTVIGGEPLSNPDVDKWITGLRNLFPDVSDFKVCTNGLLIDKHKHNIKKWWDLGVVLEVSAHTPEQYKKILKDLKQLFAGLQVKRYTSESIDIPEYYKDDYDEIFLLNGRPIVLIAEEFQFYEWGARNITKDTVYLHNSNPKEAHSNCEIYDCHYIYKGELYKCGTMVGAQELVKKYNLDERSRKLIRDYTPITPQDSDLKNKLENLTNNPIKQCSLCPSKTVDQPRPILDTDIKKVSYSKT